MFFSRHPYGDVHRCDSFDICAISEASRVCCHQLLLRLVSVRIVSQDNSLEQIRLIMFITTIFSEMVILNFIWFSEHQWVRNVSFDRWHHPNLLKMSLSSVNSVFILVFEKDGFWLRFKNVLRLHFISSSSLTVSGKQSHQVTGFSISNPADTWKERKRSTTSRHVMTGRKSRMSAGLLACTLSITGFTVRVQGRSIYISRPDVELPSGHTRFFYSFIQSFFPST